MVQANLCIGCGVCVAVCNQAGPMQLSPQGQLVPSLTDLPNQSAASFSQLCPFSPEASSEDILSGSLFPEAQQSHPEIGRFLETYVGHVLEGDFRARGSSGGMVNWILEELLRTGQIDGVAHVQACSDPHSDGRFFRYQISRTPAEIRQGAQSRYYPVELSEVLAEIQRHPGRYAVVGIPCFIKAVQLLRQQDPILRERIVFTVGLFCGHMKSARFVESVANQVGIALDQIQRIDFRRKAPGRPANAYYFHLTLYDGRTIEQPWRKLSDGDWGAGFFMNSACNYCDDVVAETADVSCGDAWVEPYSSDPGGTNVVITRSAALAAIVRQGITEGRLYLKGVDGKFVAETQAAGIRQRREGLAYRLTWRRSGIRPRKRVRPGTDGLRLRRKLIYRLRNSISWWSPRIFQAAQRVRLPFLYNLWARISLGLYKVLAYAGIRAKPKPQSAERQGKR